MSLRSLPTWALLSLGFGGCNDAAQRAQSSGTEDHHPVASAVNETTNTADSVPATITPAVTTTTNGVTETTQALPPTPSTAISFAKTLEQCEALNHPWLAVIASGAKPADCGTHGAAPLMRLTRDFRLWRGS